jgi:hypothetical protein
MSNNQGISNAQLGQASSLLDLFDVREVLAGRMPAPLHLAEASLPRLKLRIPLSFDIRH